jgi:hypothetical protein
MASPRVRARSSRAIVEAASSETNTTSSTAGSSLRARRSQNALKPTRPLRRRSASNSEVIR